MRKAVVVGGAGFVGSHVSRELVNAGWDIAIFGPAGPGGPIDDIRGKVRVIEGSIADGDMFRDAVEEFSPDLIVSLVGYNASSSGLLRSSEANADEAIRINALGLRAILEVSRRAEINRIIWASSVVAYGPPAVYGHQRVTERDPLRPITTYGLTKALAEQISVFYRDVYGLQVTAVRLPLVFGPGRWYAGVLGSVLSLLDAETPPTDLPLELSDHPFDLVYAADVGRAIRQLAEHDAPIEPAYNMAGFTTTFPELVGAIQRRRPRLSVSIRICADSPQYPLMADDLIRADIKYSYRFTLETALDDYLAR
jgi:UDP-glucose 4-epimerase